MVDEQVDPSSRIPDYQQSFIRILNNRAKIDDRFGVARARGFVVIARGGTSLRLLQSLCSEQTYNHDCLTARYRLHPNRAIGTVLMSFLKDLGRIRDGRERDLSGSINPKLPHDRWSELTQEYFETLSDSAGSELQSLLQQQKGYFSEDTVFAFFSALYEESVLGTGQRLVLFGELSEPCTDPTEWRIAMESLFTRLPERVGLVLSGAPPDFHLPTEDPHFLEIELPAGEDKEPGQEGSPTYKYKDSSFHKDEPAREDNLGVNRYANAIARFLLHPQTTPPLTMGIHGPWGKGKSSFMKLVEAALIKYAEVNNLQKPNETSNHQKWTDLAQQLDQFKTNTRGRTPTAEELAGKKLIDENLTAVWTTMKQAAAANVISVTFNAWQFEDAKQTWAGLASRISEKLERALPWRSRQFLKLKYAWTKRKLDLVLQILLPLAVIFLIAVLAGLGVFQEVLPPENSFPVLRLLLPAGSVLTVWFVSSQLLKVVQPISTRVLSYVQMPNYRDQMGFQHLVKADLKFLHKFLLKRYTRCRVVVYIDDLDRCSEEKIMEILQAINLVLASCKFFVFVGMDTEMVYRAIRSHYKHMGERFPEDYLRKIIQISFYLPKTSPKERLEYLSTLFSANARQERQKQMAADLEQVATPQLSMVDGLVEYDLEGVLPVVNLDPQEVEDTADELEAFDAYGDFIDDNPREIKRLINIHRLVKILLQKQGTTWSNDRPAKLVKWLIFCDLWPELIDDVLDLVEKSKSSANCLGELADALVASGGSSGLKRFADFRDVLTSQDIDEDFRLAADLSQLVSKSPADTGAPPPAAGNNTVDPLLDLA